MEEFKKKPLEERKQKCQELIKNDQNRIPVIVGRASKCKLAEMKKPKLLVPKNFRLSYITTAVRNELRLKEDQAITLSVGNSILKQGNHGLKLEKVLGDLYESLKSEDGFLYIEYGDMIAFGN